MKRRPSWASRVRIGKKGDGDHQQGKKAGTGHLLHGPDHHGAIILPPTALIPQLQILVGLLDHHDGRVHHGPDGDGDPAQGHDVGREAQRPEGDERKEYDNGQGDHRDDGARDVPEEDEDHQGHGDEHLDDRGFQVVDGAQDQVGAVVDRDDLHAGGQTGLDLPDFRLDPPDHVQGILPVPHDDNAGDHVPLAVQIGHPPAELRPQNDVCDVFEADGRA